MTWTREGDLKPDDQIGGWTLSHRAKYDGTVWFAQRDGTQGVLKCYKARYWNGKPTYRTQRFRAEVSGMVRLQDDPGVLPLLDWDPEREWLVTELAEVLADRFGTTPDLRAVVEAVADLADTLTRIRADLEISHRDLKPANLFWLHDRPLIGDFGIARWPTEEPMTASGEKLGPWGFIAPEALESEGKVDWFAADVYSLAKCLWAIAAGRKYPVQGQLLIREEAASLWPVGGKPALDLGRLLEAATAHRPGRRPSMIRFRDELRVWLELHPPGSTIRPTPGPKHALNAPELHARNVDAGGPVGVARSCTRQLVALLRSCRPGGADIATVGDGEIQADLLEIDIPDPDWLPDWVSTAALTWPDHPEVRVVAQGVGDGEDDITYLAQWQLLASESTWKGTTAIRSAHSLARWPSDIRIRQQLAAQLADDDPGDG